jgi:Zn-dependent protease with chaperone function
MFLRQHKKISSSLLQETYYGKNSELLKVEALMKTIKDRFGRSFSSSINRVPEFKEVADIIKNLFNFETCLMYVVPETRQTNAFTLPIQFSVRNQIPPKDFYKLESTKNGIRFANSKNKRLFICLTNEMIYQATPEELTAIILHEVGHNFFLIEKHESFLRVRQAAERAVEALLKFLLTASDPSSAGDDTLDYFKAFIQTLTALFLPSGVAKFILGTLNSFPVIYEVKAVFNYITRIIDEIIGFIHGVLGFPIHLLYFPIYMLTGIIRHMSTTLFLDNYMNEKFADNFAESYGYGVQIATFFSRDLGRMQSYYNSNPITSWMYVYKIAVDHFAGPHPNNLKRVRQAKEKLEYELQNNSTLSPAQIKEITRDIDLVEEVIMKSTKYGYQMKNEERFAPIFELKDTLGQAYIKDDEVYDFEKKLLKRLM